ncbi:MAG: nucleotide modification associated domain-containing protein [Thermodesulfobacteriota bacterium]
MTFETVLKRMAEIHRAKNADYGASYDLAPQLLGIPAHLGILVRITDKLARACRLAQGQAALVKGEALADTLLDLANYAVLALIALEGDKPRE